MGFFSLLLMTVLVAMVIALVLKVKQVHTADYCLVKFQMIFFAHIEKNIHNLKLIVSSLHKMLGMNQGLPTVSV